MQKMIDDILALSSLPNNTVKEKANLQTILNDVLLLLEHIIQRKKAVVTSDDLPDAYVIPSLFRQLFLNLISNALKFSRKDVPPQITITHSYLDAKKIVTSNKEAACYIAIKVADNGIGFSNEFSQKIFTLFQRLHNDKEYEGTGLGLAICKRIVEEHQGMIYAGAKLGEGAVFTIIIPLQAA
jgi:two-component system CheB/CheR fusion protein